MVHFFRSSFKLLSPQKKTKLKAFKFFSQNAVLDWVLPEAEPEKRICVHIFYLRGDPRKHLQVRREGRWDRKEANIGGNSEQVTTCRASVLNRPTLRARSLR